MCVAPPAPNDPELTWRRFRAGWRPPSRGRWRARPWRPRRPRRRPSRRGRRRVAASSSTAAGQTSGPARGRRGRGGGSGGEESPKRRPRGHRRPGRVPLQSRSGRDAAGSPAVWGQPALSVEVGTISSAHRVVCGRGRDQADRQDDRSARCSTTSSTENLSRPTWPPRARLRRAPRSRTATSGARPLPRPLSPCGPCEARFRGADPFPPPIELPPLAGAGGPPDARGERALAQKGPPMSARSPP